MWQVIVFAGECPLPADPLSLSLAVGRPYCRSHAEYSKSKLARHLENFQKKYFLFLREIIFVEHIGVSLLLEVVKMCL